MRIYEEDTATFFFFVLFLLERSNTSNSSQVATHGLSANTKFIICIGHFFNQMEFSYTKQARRGDKIMCYMIRFSRSLLNCPIGLFSQELVNIKGIVKRQFHCMKIQLPNLQICS